MAKKETELHQGTINIRGVPKDLVYRLKQAALAERRTVKGFLLALAEERIQELEKKGAAPEEWPATMTQAVIYKGYTIQPAPRQLVDTGQWELNVFISWATEDDDEESRHFVKTGGLPRRPKPVSSASHMVNKSSMGRFLAQR